MNFTMNKIMFMLINEIKNNLKHTTHSSEVSSSFTTRVLVLVVNIKKSVLSYIHIQSTLVISGSHRITQTKDMLSKSKIDGSIPPQHRTVYTIFCRPVHDGCNFPMLISTDLRS